MHEDSTPPIAAPAPRAVAEVEALFHEALELPAGSDVEAWLRARVNDGQLRREVASLLSAHQGLCAFERDARAAGPRVPSAAFGAYRAVDVLGRGGMSVVYRARRTDGQFDQTVALKVLAPFFHTPEFVRRFDRERQVLASLRHPHIATLIDGGVSSDGEPYLVTELVDGRPLDSHADAAGLDVPARLRLLQQVCDAVDHAHRQLVVHADLKPGNILVTGEGFVKLLDFGTARLLNAGEQVTATHERLLTPRYASPEQLRGERTTVASDVYSLGVVAFELLCGASPFGETTSAADILARASGHGTTRHLDAAVSEAAARTFGMNAEKLARALRGDLTAIVAKAMAVDPAARYGTVRQFADDIERYLLQRPVSARGQAWRYRGQRFLRRHRRRLAFAGLSGVLLLGTVVYGLVQYARAQRRLEQLQSLSSSVLSDIYGEVSSLPGSTRARLLIVERTQRQLDQVLADDPSDPEVRAALAQAYIQLGDTIGEPFAISIGDSAGALDNYRKAQSLIPAAPSAPALAALFVRAHQGITEVLIRAGRYDEAARTAESALPAAERLWRTAPAGFRVVGRTPAVVYIRLQAILGHAQMRAADVTRDVAGVTRALEQFERTMRTAAEARRLDPAMPDLEGRYSQYAAYAHELLGDFTGDRRHYERARLAHRRSAEASYANFVATPSAQTKRDYADGLLWEGWGDSLCGAHDAAVEHTASALALFEELAAENRDSREVGLDLASAHFRLGAVLGVAGRLADAKTQLATARAMVTLPDRSSPTDRETVVLVAQIYEHQARVLAGLGETGAARVAARAAVAAVRGTGHVPTWRELELEAALGSLERPTIDAGGTQAR